KMNWKNTKKQIGGSLWIIVYLILLAAMSFVGSKEFKGMNWIHYPYDFSKMGPKLHRTFPW
ncbi:hypothetical protein, partial [Streptococcus pneumoniae]|uniref:hypothetical protein n=1 Tax=Streptococcus pneumoniae TaxID=1313 RepID=UPI001CB7AAAE